MFKIIIAILIVIVLVFICSRDDSFTGPGYGDPDDKLNQSI
jgi:hypothetical protein